MADKLTDKLPPRCPDCGGRVVMYGDYMQEVTAYCVDRKGCGYEWDTEADGPGVER